MRGVWLLLLAVGCTDGAHGSMSGAGLEGETDDTDTTTTSTTPSFTVLATGQRDAMDVAIDDQYVYWLVNHQFTDESAIYRVPKTGGTTELLLTYPARIYQFALDADSIYAPTYVQAESGGQLLRIPKTGGSVEVLGDHMRYLAFVAVDDSWVYTSPVVSESPVEYELWRFAKSGDCHPESFVTGLLGPDAIAFAHDRLYVTNTGNSQLLGASVEGGTASEALPGTYALRVAADAERVYFVGNAIGECLGARIYAWSTAGSQITDLGAGVGCAMDLAVTSQSVVSVESAGNVVEHPLEGTGRHELVTGLTSPAAIAAEPDGSSVFWVDFRTGEVARLDR